MRFFQIGKAFLQGPRQKGITLCVNKENNSAAESMKLNLCSLFGILAILHVNLGIVSLDEVGLVQPVKKTESLDKEDICLEMEDFFW